MMRRTRSAYPLLLIAPSALLLGLFLVLPYLNIVVMSLRNPANGSPYAPGFTVSNYLRLATDTCSRWRTRS